MRKAGKENELRWSFEIRGDSVKEYAFFLEIRSY